MRIYLDQFVGRPEVKFDIRKFAWIGSPVSEPMIFTCAADSPYKTIADVKNAKEPAKCGSTGTVSTDFILARMLEDTLPPLKDQYRPGLSRRRRDRSRRGKRRSRLPRHDRIALFRPRALSLAGRRKTSSALLLFSGKKRDERIPDVPTITEIFDKEKVRRRTAAASPTLSSPPNHSAGRLSPDPACRRTMCDPAPRLRPIFKRSRIARRNAETENGCRP